MVSWEQMSLYLEYKFPCNMNKLLEKQNSTAGIWLVPYCSFHIYYYEKNSTFSQSFLTVTRKPLIAYYSLHQAMQDVCFQ